jgi:MFS transporter, SP family, sugar:H+ symporter
MNKKPSSTMVEKPELEAMEHVVAHAPDHPKEKVTRTVLLFAMFISLSSGIANFDNNYGGTVLLMQSFNTAFGPCHEVPGPTGAPVKLCHITALQQSLVSLTSLFTAVGSLLSTLSGTYLGRRGTIQVGASLVVVGAAGMLGTSSSYLNYMVCKCIGGVGLGFIFSGTIVYGVESLPPRRRGVSPHACVNLCQL